MRGDGRARARTPWANRCRGRGHRSRFRGRRRRARAPGRIGPGISPRDRHRPRLPGRRTDSAGTGARSTCSTRALPAFAGVDAVAHLAVDLTPDADRDGQRQRNTRAAQTVITAAFAAGVRRVVVVGSALAYGAYADNPVPLPDDAPLRAVPEASAVGDLLEIERIAAASRRSHRGLAVTVLRPAVVLGAGDREPMAALLGAPRLLRIRGADTHWQFCHVADLAAAVELAALAPAGRARRAGERGLRRAGSTTTSWSGSAAGAAWSCPSGSRSGWPSGCTGWASPRRRRASWPTSSTRGWSTAAGCGRPAGRRRTPTPRRSPTTWAQPSQAGRGRDGDRPSGGAAPGGGRRCRGRRGRRARRHGRAGPPGPPPPLGLTVPSSTVDERSRVDTDTPIHRPSGRSGGVR